MFKSNWPIYSKKMCTNVKKLVKSGKINQWNNPLIFELEKKIGKYFHIKHALTVSNGTVALELCLRSINIKPNDEVIVTPRSFIASVSCVNICNGTPIFCDVNKVTGNIDLEHIKSCVTSKTKAIIIVHLGGMPEYDIQEICDFAKSKNIYVINDLAQAIASKVNNKYICNYGDLSIFSFCTDKEVPCGEGGAVLTNFDNLFLKMFSYREHGKNFYSLFNNLENKSKIISSGHKYRYVYDSIGSNFRMHILEASLCNDELDLLEIWTNIRRRNAQILINKLKDCKIINIHVPDENVYCSYYRFYCYVKEEFKDLRDKILEQINEKEIPCFQGACSEIYKESAFNLDLNLPNAKLLGETSLCFLVDPSYDEKKMNKIGDIVGVILKSYEK